MEMMTKTMVPLFIVSMAKGMIIIISLYSMMSPVLVRPSNMFT